MFEHIETICFSGTLAHVQFYYRPDDDDVQILDAHIFFPFVNINIDGVRKQIKNHRAELLADASNSDIDLSVGFVESAAEEVKSVISIPLIGRDLFVPSDDATDITMQILPFAYEG